MFKNMLKIGLGLSVVFASQAYAAPTAVDAAVPKYKKVAGVSGALSSVGSDTLNNLMTLWSEDFKKIYPSVKIQVQGAGSSTAPPALAEGTANFGPMSRKMKDNEIKAFEAKYGYKPTEIRVALDALGVFVHKDNPIKAMTIPQVDAVFSQTRKCGAAKNIAAWGDLGLTGDWAKRTMTLYGRNSVSGTYGYFKEHALCKGDFQSTVNEQPGSASVVQSIAGSTKAIGYAGIGYATAGVRAVPLANKAGEAAVSATAQNAINGTYPLSRYLVIYVNKAPGKPLQPMVKEYIKLVLSQQGQQTVVKDGYIPLPAKVVAAELKKLN